jgi:hypothetical protein
MHLAKIKTTLAEGVLSSTTFKGSQVIYDDLKTANVPYFWFTIDIDPEVVFNSILKRRVSKGNIDPLDTDKVCAKYRPVMTSHNKAVDYGIWTHYGDRNDVLQMLNLLATDGLSDVDYRLIRKFDINKRNAELKRWTDMGQVAPTPEMIAQYAPAPKEEPKPTSNALGGFFV